MTDSATELALDVVRNWNWAVTVAFVAAVIAVFQWLNARQKLRLDVFDKRFAVFEEVYAFTSNISFQGQQNLSPNLDAVISARLKSKYLFGGEVVKIIKEIEGCLFDIKVFLDVRDGRVPEVGDTARYISERSQDILSKKKRLDECRVELSDAISRYLYISTRKRWIIG